MKSIWINFADNAPDEIERVRAIVQARTQTLKESSEVGRVELRNVRCECGERLPWKILADGESDLTEFARQLRNDIATILSDAGTLSVTVA